MEFQTYWRFSTIHSTNSTWKIPPAFKKEARECKRHRNTWGGEQPGTQGSGRKWIIKGVYTTSTPMTLGEGGSLENIREHQALPLLRQDLYWARDGRSPWDPSLWEKGREQTKFHSVKRVRVNTPVISTVLRGFVATLPLFSQCKEGFISNSSLVSAV